MNANFKGVAIILSDKSANDIWDKIGLIDDKDAEQDEKDIEQDEAIAGKLDKDEGMGLVDEKLGGIDNAIESLTEELSDLTEDVGTLDTQLSTLTDTVNDVISKLNDVISNAVKIEEETLWTGSVTSKNSTIVLSEAVTNFDYIDIYFSGDEGYSHTENNVSTFKSSDLMSRGAVIGSAEVSDVGSDPALLLVQYIIIEKINNSGRDFIVTESCVWRWNGDASDNGDATVTSTYANIYRIVGRKMTPLSDIINVGE